MAKKVTVEKCLTCPFRKTSRALSTKEDWCHKTGSTIKDIETVLADCPLPDDNVGKLEARVKELEGQIKEWELSFQLFDDAIRRGTEMFRQAHPDYVERMALPSTDKLIMWLLFELAELRAWKERVIGFLADQDVHCELPTICTGEDDPSPDGCHACIDRYFSKDPE